MPKSLRPRKHFEQRCWIALGADQSLVECSLRDSDLTYADFSHGNLERSDFEGAKMFRTKLHKSRDAGAQCVFGGRHSPRGAGAAGFGPAGLAGGRRTRPGEWFYFTLGYFARGGDRPAARLVGVMGAVFIDEISL